MDHTVLPAIHHVYLYRCRTAASARSSVDTTRADQSDRGRSEAVNRA